MAHHGHDEREALIALARAEREAPQFFKLTRFVEETVTAILKRPRRRSERDSFSALATRLGLRGPDHDHEA
jgi:hypothetical protein